MIVYAGRGHLRCLFSFTMLSDSMDRFHARYSSLSGQADGLLQDEVSGIGHHASIAITPPFPKYS